MKNQKNLIFIALVILILLVTGSIFLRHRYVGKISAAGSKDSGKEIYICPMHPNFTSDKPGDCIICGMKLIKKEKAPEQSLAAAQSSTPSQEKSLKEICVEHNCTMKNCTMHVRANLKPGERVICPICGESISTLNGKVVEIVTQSKATGSAQATGNGQHEANPKKERKLLYYRNPMNPEVTSPTPMKDSMGMDYVPVYEEAKSTEGGGGVYISPEKQQLIGVKTEAVTKRNLTKAIRAFGKIAYDPNLYVAQEEYVQALKTVNATKNSVLASVAEQSHTFLEAAEKKLLLLGMSKSEIEQLAKEGLPQENLYLPAGQNTIWIYVNVYEYEIGLVKIGQAVEIENVAYPGEIFNGKVVSINPVLDSESRTNQVRVEMVNPDEKLKPQMFVNAKIQTDLGKKLAVPQGAVLDTGIRKIVYLSKEGDMLESREVTLGQKAEGYYEVLGGLNEGDIVVTSGNFLIDSESKLKSVSQGSEHKHGN